MGILSHQELINHKNIDNLLQVRWDTQDGPDLATPTLILEHANIGSLAAFQGSRKVVLSAGTKRKIYLDVAKGLQALHTYGIVHGDVKSGYDP